MRMTPTALALLRYLEQHDPAWVSYAELMDRANVSSRWRFRALAELERNKMIERAAETMGKQRIGAWIYDIRVRYQNEAIDWNQSYEWVCALRLTDKGRERLTNPGPITARIGETTC